MSDDDLKPKDPFAYKAPELSEHDKAAQDEFLFDNQSLADLPTTAQLGETRGPEEVERDEINLDFSKNSDAWADTLMGELAGTQPPEPEPEPEMVAEMDIEFQTSPDAWEETQLGSPVEQPDAGSEGLRESVDLIFNDSPEAWEETQLGGIDPSQIPVLDDVVNPNQDWDPAPAEDQDPVDIPLEATPDLAATLREVIDRHLPEMVAQAVSQSLDQVRDNISLQIQEQIDLKLAEIIEQVMLEFRDQQEIDRQS